MSWSVVFSIRFICKTKISAIFLNCTLPCFIGIYAFLHFGQYFLLLVKILLIVKWLLKKLYQKLRNCYGKLFLRKNEWHQAFSPFSRWFISFISQFLLNDFSFLSFLGKIELDKVNLMIKIFFVIAFCTLVI